MECVFVEYSKCEVQAEGPLWPENKSAFGAKKIKMNLNDDPEENRGRPRTSHTDENCLIVEGLFKEDCRTKVCKISKVFLRVVPEKLKLSQSSVSLGAENAIRELQNQSNECVTNRKGIYGNVQIHQFTRNSKLNYMSAKSWSPCSGIVESYCSLNFLNH